MINEPTGLPLLARRVVNRIGRPFGINPFPRAFQNPLTSAGQKEPAVLFNEIYGHNYWGSTESRSGVGSETAVTARYREHLSTLLRDRGLRRVFDAPCGDLNWMSGLIAAADIDYTGGDISERVVGDVRRNHPRLDVRVFDITADPFPEADVWHCRDCLFHLPFAYIRRALENFARSRIRYALLTTHSSRLLHRNLDVTTGGFRYLDLEMAPIHLPNAEDYVPDYQWGRDFPRYVGLWSRDQIAEAARGWPDAI